MRKKVITLSVISAVLTAFIFFNSLQSSVVSNTNTDTVIGFLTPILQAIESVFGELNWFFLLRKAAHLAEFCALGVAVRSLAYTLVPVAGRPLAAHAAFYVLAVAVADEFIQSFSDRTSAVYDILIDFSGAMIGFLLVALIRFLRQKHTRKAD